MATDWDFYFIPVLANGQLSVINCYTVYLLIYCLLIWACGEEGCGGLGVQVSEVRGSEVQGRGRSKKTWEQSVKCDIRKYGLQRVYI